MSEIKLFPIGYIASTNANSKGNFVASQLEASSVNIMFEPNAGCDKSKVGYSLVSEMENRAIWTRKAGEHKHQLTYSYENIFNWEFKQIRRFIRDIANFRVNSFYTVDFSSGQKITALATGANWNASIYDTTDFSATVGEGGRYAFIWYPQKSKFRVGIVNTKVDDSSITFPNTSDFGDLEEFSIGNVYAYPMYRVYLTADNEGFEVTDFVDAHLEASFCGPVRSGDISFVQRDVK
jgi:hypothetical protein